MAKKLPYFPFYYLDWLSSSSVCMMTHEEKGLFIDMLSRCYNDDGLPDDNKKLQRLFNCDEHLLSSVKSMFYSVEGLLKNEKLDSVINAQDKMIKSKSEAGKASAKARAANKLRLATPVEHVLNSVPTESQRNSTNKTEQNKTEQKNKKTKEKKECALFSLTLPLFESRGAKHLHQEFCDYWSAINEMTDMPRWKEDPYFKSNMTMKVTGWIDRSKTQAGKNNPVLNHPHQEFLEQWIIKAEPTNAQIEAAKSILLNNYQDLETKYLMKALESNSTANIDTLFKRSKSMQVRTHKDKLAPRMAPKSDLPEEELTIEQIECMAKMTPPEVFEAKYPELLERLENHKKGANK